MKRFLIIMAFVLLAGALVWKVGIPLYKRRALAKAWMPYLQMAGSPISEDEIVKKLKLISDREIDVLIDASKALEAKDWTKAANLSSQVFTILKKAGLTFKFVLGK